MGDDMESMNASIYDNDGHKFIEMNLYKKKWSDKLTEYVGFGTTDDDDDMVRVTVRIIPKEKPIPLHKSTR